MADGAWVSVRHVLSHQSEGDGVYEERITTWQCSSIEEAIALAETEVAEHCGHLDCTDTGIYQGFLLADDPGDLRSGTEIFSLVRESPLETREYLDRFFDTGRELQRPVDPS
jgi:hypothetical protein